AAQRLVRDRDNDGNFIFDDFDFMSSVLGAARIFGIDELLQWQMPRRGDNEDWQWQWRNFRADATRISQRILFEYASRPEKDPNPVALDGATKQRVRFHLEQIRRIIDKEGLPAWKKQDLFDAISELEREINKARTLLAAVLDVVGKAIDGTEPVMDALRKVV